MGSPLYSVRQFKEFPVNLRIAAYLLAKYSLSFVSSQKKAYNFQDLCLLVCSDIALLVYTNKIS